MIECMHAYVCGILAEQSDTELLAISLETEQSWALPKVYRVHLGMWHNWQKIREISFGSGL
jgi:hypothetical protein